MTHDGPAAAHRGKNGDAVFLFKVAWYASNVVVALACLLSVYLLFGLETLAYFLAGVSIAAVAAIAFLASRRLSGALLKMLRK